MYSTANCMGRICLKDGYTSCRWYCYFFFLIFIHSLHNLLLFIVILSTSPFLKMRSMHRNSQKLPTKFHTHAEQIKWRSSSTKKLNDASNQINAFICSTILVQRFSHHRHILINSLRARYISTPIACILLYSSWIIEENLIKLANTVWCVLACSSSSSTTTTTTTTSIWTKFQPELIWIFMISSFGCFFFSSLLYALLSFKSIMQIDNDHFNDDEQLY